jgi:hypothetical protein
VNSKSRINVLSVCLRLFLFSSFSLFPDNWSVEPNSGIVLQLCRNRFVPSLFQFVSHPIIW